MSSETLGSLFFLLVLFAMWPTANLASYPRLGDDARTRRRKDRWIVTAVAIVGGLMVAMAGRHVAGIAAGLCVIAFNLGHWRGSQEPPPELSSDPREIWSRNA